MKHLVIADYGSFVGIRSALLVVKSHNPEQAKEHTYPLNRLSTISIAKRGISLSSDLIEALSARNIKLFFLDFRGVAHTALLGQSQHGVVAMRIAQIGALQKDTLPLAKKIVIGKIKNQRAVLNYQNKYHKIAALEKSAQELLSHAAKADNARDMETLLGFEGASANAYFQALRQAQLFSFTFTKREGRGSQEINNSMLNLGYAVLSSYILNAIINAGLEPYLGVLHSIRPGKMALVLDLMEEYRAWVVDRAVIKLRSQSEGRKFMDINLKKAVISEIQKTCAKSYLYKGKKLKLEHIIQRQVYRLCGEFYGERKYKPYLFNGKNKTMNYPLRQEYLISYDVEDNKIRTYLYKELAKYGLSSVQKSVFWGYLTRAELTAIQRYLNQCIQKQDKAFITHTNFNGRGQSFFIGHAKEEFRDWRETDVI